MEQIDAFMKSIDKLITTSSALKEAIAAINTAEFVAIDTEFMRESTYYPHLCLVQLCAGTHAFCVDPLAPMGWNSIHFLI